MPYSKQKLIEEIAAETPQKKTRGKIHSQVGQRCEHPNLSGNGSTEAVLTQSPTANRSPESQLPQKHSPKKDDKRQNSLTDRSKMRASQSQWGWFRSGCSYPISYSKQKPRESVATENTPKKMTRGKNRSQVVQRCELSNLGGNGSAQAVHLQPSTANRSPPE